VINILDQHGSGHAAAPETAAVNPVSCECSTGLDVPCAELTGITDWPDMFDLTDGLHLWISVHEVKPIH